MVLSVRRKITFEASRIIRPIFTRGNVAISTDGRILASCVDEDVVLTDLWDAGEEMARIEGVSCQ
jgi:U3 small nucleolar RNA-associated protein 13